MKKILQIAGLLLISIGWLTAKPLTVSGNAEHRAQDWGAVAPFDILWVSGQAEVDFQQGAESEYSVSAYGPDNLLKLLQVKSQNGTLSIQYKEPLVVLGDYHVRILVTAPTLKRVEVHRHGEVNMALPVQFGELTLWADGQTEIDIEQMSVDSLHVHTLAEAEVDIGALTCQRLQVQTDGSSTFESQRTDCRDGTAQAANRSTVVLLGFSGETLTAQSNQAARMEIKGKTARAVLTARGRSSIEAGSLQAERADVMAANGSFIDVRVSDQLNAQAESRGVVKYRGWPKEINRSGKGLVRKN